MSEQSNEQYRQPVMPETVGTLLKSVYDMVGEVPSDSSRYTRTEFDSHLAQDATAHVTVECRQLQLNAYGEIVRVSLLPTSNKGRDIPFERTPIQYCFYTNPAGTGLVKVFRESPLPFGIDGLGAEKDTTLPEESVTPVVEAEAQDLRVLLQQVHQKFMFTRIHQLAGHESMQADGPAMEESEHKPEFQATAAIRAGWRRISRWLLKMLE